MRTPNEKFSEISGAGGGGSSEKAHTPIEAPNTLRSVIKGRILDMIAYGPIKGLKNGLKSVYLDGTPVENADGSKNFEGFTLQTRYGDVDQPYMEGFPAIENSIEIGTEVLYDNPPVRAVSNNNANAALVTIQFAALTQVIENGDSVAYQVPVAIDVRSGTGAWNVKVSETISGKTTSPFPITYRVPLEGPGPFSIRVRRLTKESQTQKIQDKLSWTILNEVIDERLSYPSIAYVGITVDSQLFGSTMPARTYDMELSIVNVPSNYDPITRVYTGLWNGTFKKAWTDNPAWCYYDLATHPVIGAGLKDVDKWVLYRIGQYCDELVEDGYGGMEPRFTCNTLFAEQEDAISALNTFASAFRGMAYWGTNTMTAVADMPTPVVKIASPSNVIDGDFEYVGTSIRERHSVAVVMWNDMSDQGKAVPEVYEDPISIDMYGWRETRVTAVACSSRGQALRLAKWILYSERMETQTVQYKASLDHADVRPGDIIQLADPDYQGARMSGRVIAYEARKITLDQVPSAAVQAVTGTWYLSVLMPDGSIPRVQVTSFVGNVANLFTVLPDIPVPGAVWALSSTDLELPQFRVVSVVESGSSTYSITATEYDPRKYDIVEKGLILPARPTSLLPSGPVTPPMDLSFVAYKYFAGNSEHQGMVISWTPPKDARVDSYVLDVMAPDAGGGFATVYTGSGTSFDLKDIMGGQWTIRVRSIAAAAAGGITSAWVARTVQIAQLLLPTPPDSITVAVGTFNITLTPHSAYPNAIYEFWRSMVPLTVNLIESNATQLPTGPYLVDANLRSGTQYYYYVRGTNQYGRSTWVPAQGKTTANFDDILQAVTNDVKNGELYKIINSEIKTVATDTATQLVDDAVKELQGQIDNITDALAYDKTKPYKAADFTRVGNGLWQAVVNVPADPSGNSGPPNPLYWRSVGTALATADATALQAQTNTEDIAVIDGKVTSMASQLTVLRATARRDNGESEAQDALAGFNASAGFTQDIKVLATSDVVLAQRITYLQADLNGNQANLRTLEQTMVTNDNALAQSITDLNVSFLGNSAVVQNQLVALATAQSTTADQLTTLSTDFEGNKTVVQNQITAVSNAQGATATELNTLKSTVGGNTAAIQTVQNTQATLEGNLKAQYAIKLQLTSDGRAYAAGMGIDITNSGGVTQSSILFQADRIAMINTNSGQVSIPFLMEGGTVYINSGMFKTASIDFAYISDTLQSTDYIAGQRGWRLSKGGALEFNGVVAGAGRLTMTNRSIRVWDGNNVKRVQLGDLNE